MGFMQKPTGSPVSGFPEYLEERIEYDSIQPIWGKISTGREPHVSGCRTLHYRKILMSVLTLHGRTPEERDPGSAEVTDNCHMSQRMQTWSMVLWQPVGSGEDSGGQL